MDRSGAKHIQVFYPSAIELTEAVLSLRPYSDPPGTCADTSPALSLGPRK